MVMRLTGLSPKNNCPGEDQQQLLTTVTSSGQREHPTSTNAQLSDSVENLVLGPRRVLHTKTEWSTLAYNER
jgi:hypothetical protein